MRDPHTLLDLGKHQMVMAYCGCGHHGPVKPSAIPATFDLARVPIKDLPRHLKCSKCGGDRVRVRVMTR